MDEPGTHDVTLAGGATVASVVGVWHRLKRRLPVSWQDRYGLARWWIGRAWRAVRAGVSPVSYVGRYVFGRRRLRIHGVPIHSDNPRLAWSLCRDIFETREYDLPGFTVQPGWRVVDLGGNIGLFAVLAASRGASVVSYEPHPQLAHHLAENTAKWDVECHQAAVVGAPSGPLTLYVNPGRDIRNSLLPRDVADGSELTDGVEVPTVPIADVLDRECDLLKIDIEGGEFELLAQGRTALRNAKRVIAELHPFAGDPDRAMQLVRDAGFDVELHGSIHRGGYPSLTAVRRVVPS
jgi:FkbM family methyltransferase